MRLMTHLLRPINKRQILPILLITILFYYVRLRILIEYAVVNVLTLLDKKQSHVFDDYLPLAVYYRQFRRPLMYHPHQSWRFVHDHDRH